MTIFVDSVSQWGGVPVGVNPLFNKIFNTSQGHGKAWFVDPNQSNGNGQSPKTPFSTMQAAFNVITSGDIIYCLGNIREQLVAPVQVFDITIIGCGNRPRNADAVPLGGAYSAVTWRAPASGGVAAQATLRILQQGWTIYNILFNMLDANSAGIEIVRNAAAADDERDGSHASILNCTFAGAGVGIRSGATSYTENVFDTLVQGNKFLSNTTAIKVTGGGAYNWLIKDNDFYSNTNDIVGAFTASKIEYNRMSLAPTACIVLTGGASNMVHYNALPGTYANGTLYAPGTSDNWNGNAASTGFTAAVPT